MKIFNQYDTAIACWRPIFGNEAHIRARDLIADINRMRPQYEELVEKRKLLKTTALRNKPSKRMNQLADQLSTAMRRVVEITQAI